MVWNYITQRRPVARAFTARIGKTMVIFPSAFLSALSSSALMLGIVFYAREQFGASAITLGMLSGTWSLAYGLGCFLLRPITLRLLPRYSMLVAAALLCTSAAWLSLASSMGGLFAGYAMFGCALAFFWPTTAGWLSTNIEGRQLTRSIGRFNVCWSSGAIIGPLAAGWLSEFSPAFPIYFAGLGFLAMLCMILGAILTLSRLGEDDTEHRAARTPETSTEAGTSLRFPAWLGCYTAFVVAGAIFAVFPLSAAADLHLNKALIGWIFLGRALMSTLMLGVAGHTEFWHFRGKLMPGGMLLLALVIGSMAMAHSWLLAAILIGLVGLLCGMQYVMSQYYGVAGCRRRGSRMAVHEGLVSAGLISGAVLGGIVYQFLGTTGLYSALAAIAIAGATVQIMMLRRQP